MSNLEKVAVVATAACILKFVIEGVSFTAFGHPVNLGHVDPTAYATLLAPLWGSHGYIKGKEQDSTGDAK